MLRYRTAIPCLVLLSGMLSAQSPVHERTAFRIPIQFTRNDGQWGERILYASPRAHGAAIITREGIGFTGHSRDQIPSPPQEAPDWAIVPARSISFIHPSATLQIRAEGRTPTKSNFYQGDVESAWRENVPNYSRIVYRDVWKNIDVAYEERNGRLHQEISIRPGGNIGDIGFALGGMDDREAHSLQAAASSGGHGSGGNHEIRPVISKGELRFQISAGKRSMPATVYTDLAALFGGSGVERVEGTAIDDSNNIYFSGTTQSRDLPTVRAFQSQFAGGDNDVYLARLNCDGRTLDFCTYLGGSGADVAPGGIRSALNGIFQHHLDITRQGKIVLSGSTRSKDFPIRANAVQPSFQLGVNPDSLNASNGFIACLSKDGMLERSTYLGGPGGVSLVWQTIDRDGYIYVAGEVADDTVWFITPGVVQPRLRYTGKNPPWSINGTLGAVIAKISPDLSSVSYATYFFAVDGDNLQAIQHTGSVILNVDRAKNLYISGVLQGNFPIVNAIQPTHNYSTTYGGYITKLNTDATGYVYSTFFGGKYNDLYNTFLDDNDNLYVTGFTDTTGFLYTKTYLKSSKNGAYVSKLSPDGRLLFSTVIGMRQGENVLLDRCGNVVMLGFGGGRADVDTILDGSSAHARNTDIACILDSTSGSLMYSTYYTTIDNLNYQLNWPHRPFLDSSGSINYVSELYRPVAEPYFHYRLKNSMRDSIGGVADVIVTRFRLPVCQPLRCELSSIDTLHVSSKRRLSNPAVFDVQVTLACSDAFGVVDLLNGELTLPRNLILTPDSQSRALPPMMFQPGEEKTFHWSVRYDSSLAAPPWDTLSFSAVYMPRSQQVRCPVPATECAARIAIVTDPEKEPTLSCAIDAPERLVLDATESRFQPDTIEVRYSLRNDDSRPIRIDTIVLSLPAGMGIRTAVPGDTLRAGMRMLPGEVLVGVWRLVADHLPTPRSVSLVVHARDSYGFMVSSCTHRIAVPTVTALQCATSSNGPILVEINTGATNPAPVRVKLRLENPLDTVAATIVASVDLSRASHLRLSPGEQTNRIIPFIDAGRSTELEWRFDVVPPLVTSEDDTVRFLYWWTLDDVPRSCTAVLRLIARKFVLVCESISCDTLAVQGSVYTPDPFALRATLLNTGTAEAPVAAWRLLLAPGGSIVTLEDTTMSASGVPVAQTATIRWRLHASTSRTHRPFRATVLALDSSGSELVRCDYKGVIPGIAVDLTCSLRLPDTIAYDFVSDTHTPNPFTASLTLGNVLDTAQQTIESEIDLMRAPHLALAAGEQARKSVASIAAHGSAQVDWSLAVALTPHADTTDVVAVRYRHAGDMAWNVCERTVAIGGGERSTKAVCGTRGHDTLWADVRYERVIPHPAQVQYTITNTGNVPLPGCSAAIVHSRMYALVNPADSIQQYPVILPGASASREWLLEPDLEAVQPGTDTLRWVWHCDGLDDAASCMHAITLQATSPAAVVYSPWLLRFRAERNGALPVAQEIRLWPGGMASMPWQLTGGAWWLGYAPASGADTARVAIAPTSITLAEGTHNSALDLTAQHGSSPRGITVLYEITASTGISAAPSASAVELGQSYPNPISISHGGAARIAFTLSMASHATLRMHDMLGREVAVLADGDFEAGAHAVTVTATDAQGAALPAGMYLYILSCGTTTASRKLVVIR